MTILAGLRLISAVICGMLYGLGGSDLVRKWVRRYLMPAILGISITLISLYQGTFSFYYLIAPIITLIATTLGYGKNQTGDSTFLKIVYRSLIGLVFGLAGLPIAFVTGNWLLFGFHVVLCVSAMTIFGVWNPLRNARDEETILGFLFVLILIFMV